MGKRLQTPNRVLDRRKSGIDSARGITCWFNRSADPGDAGGEFFTILCVLNLFSALTMVSLSSRQDRIPNDLNTRDAGEVTCVLRQDREV